MRRLLALGTVAGSLLLPSIAMAGTYDVVACGGGANNSWTANVGEYTAGSQRFRTEGCGTSLLATPVERDSNAAAYFEGSDWAFDAPAGTRIRRLQVRRHLYSFGENLEVVGNQRSGGLAGGFAPQEAERCPAAPSYPQFPNGLCEVGSATNGPAAYRSFELNTDRVSYGVFCGNASGTCATTRDTPTIDNFPLAQAKVFAATVTLEETALPQLRASGDLLADGWRRGTEGLTLGASDGVGIRAVRALVDGAELAAVRPACDATRKVPCPNVADRALAPSALPEGAAVPLALRAEDSAGNVTERVAPVKVDRTGPAASIEPAVGRRLSASVSDGLSGVVGGTIEIQAKAGEPFRPLPTRLEGGRLVADSDVPDRDLAIRVSAVDVAGNRSEVVGEPARLRAGFGRRLRRKGTVSYGRRGIVTGRLTGRGGAALAGRTLSVVATPTANGATPQPAGQVTTSRTGRFRYVAPKGVGRLLDLEFRAPGLRAAAVELRLGVRASTTVSRRGLSVRRGGRVRFSGRIRTAGARIPASGKLVELQAFDRGRWRVFASTRARINRGGRWTDTYRFGSRGGTYRVRARLRRESGFPFDLGYSRAVRVRVR